MKLILSRKGTDSGAGRCASPIVNGEPISLPIPEHHTGRTTTTYGLSYHANPVRWLEGDQLRSVGRDQEFVAPVETEKARAWIAQIIEIIRQ